VRDPIRVVSLSTKPYKLEDNSRSKALTLLQITTFSSIMEVQL
jgi:hypothetical protein